MRYLGYLQTPLEKWLYAAHMMQIGIVGDCGKRWCDYHVNTALQRASSLETLCYYLPTLRFTINFEDKMAKQFSDFNLIDYRLSDAELDQFEEWLTKKAPSATDSLVYLAEKSYKVSLTYVENSQAWCVTVTGKEDAKFNAKSSLTTWGDEPMETLYMAVFKVAEIFGGGVWKTKTQSKRG